VFDVSLVLGAWNLDLLKTGRPAWAHLPFLCFLTTTHSAHSTHCFYFTDNWQLRPHQPTTPSSCFHFCQGVEAKNKFRDFYLPVLQGTT
jgi:hypothetical protein